MPKFNKITIPEFLPQALLISGVIFRISGVVAGSIWYDESYSLALATMPLLKMVQVAIMDFNPPGFEILLWPVIKIFGANLFGLRVLSLAGALITLWVAWILIKDLNIYQKTIAAALIGLLPIGAWIAQDGRNYSLFALLYLAGFLFIKNKKWLGLSAVIGLLCYLHVTGVFYSAALIMAAVVMDKRDLRKIVYSGSLAAILYIPGILILLRTTELNFWTPKGTIDFMLSKSMFVGLIHGPWVYLFSVIILISLFGSALIVLGPWINKMVNPVTLRIGAMVTTWLKLKPFENKSEDPNPFYLALLIWAVGPIILMAAAGEILQPIIFYRSLVGVVYPLCILFAAILTPRRLTLTTWILPYSWLMLLLVSLIAWSPTLKGGGLDVLANTINEQLQPGDIIYHATATTYLPFDYYLEDPAYLLDQYQEHDGLLQDRIQDILEIQKLPLESLDYKRAWIIWARDPTLTETANSRMAGYVSNAQLIGSASGFQFSEIELYLKEGK